MKDVKRILISRIISIDSILREDTTTDQNLFRDPDLCFAIIIAKHRNNKNKKYFLFDYWKRFRSSEIIHDNSRRPAYFLLSDITEINFDLDPISYSSVNFAPYSSIVGDYEIYAIMSDSLRTTFDISFKSRIRRSDYHYYIIKEFIKNNYNIIFNE